MGRNDDLEFALELADRADELTRARFGALDLRVETKPDLTPVTDADRDVESELRGAIAVGRPGDDVLGEEFGGTPHSPDGSGSSTRSTAPRTSCAGYRCGPA